MKKVIVFLANGFEEIEAVTMIDILRRAGVQVDTCSISNDLEVTGAHGIKLAADVRLNDIVDITIYDLVYTPGGMPGATNLRDNERVIETLRAFFDKDGKYVVAMCAAPICLERADIAEHIAGTCYPGFENQVGYKEYKKQAVVMDKNVITSMGPGTAVSLAIKVVEVLVAEETAKQLYDDTMLAFR